MSSSKEKAEGPYHLKCARCRNHGLVVPLKGHAKTCPFIKCRCWKCELITEQSRIRAQQKKLHRDTGAQCAAGPSTAGPSTAGPNTTGQTPHTCNAGAPQSGPVHNRPIHVSEPWAQGPDMAVAEGPRPGSGSPSVEEDAPCEPRPPPPDFFYRRDFSPAPLPLLHIPMPSPFVHFLYEGRLFPLMMPPYVTVPLYPPHPEQEPANSRRVFRPPASPESHHQEAPHAQEDSDV